MNPGSTRMGAAKFAWGKRTYIMGIVNVSPESFSGDGLGNVEAATAQAYRMVADGADMIDVGGQSTRPDYSPVSPEEEIRRVVPAVRSIVRAVDVPVSVDTSRAEVAEQALEAGALMINDVWGLRQAPELAGLAAKRGAVIVVAANQRGAPQPGYEKRAGAGPQPGGRRNDEMEIMERVLGHLGTAMALLVAAGVPGSNIILDPGIGFGKTVEQNLELINRLDEIRERFQRPILLGTSRKSFIGAVLDLTPEQRLHGTSATTAIGIARGADIIRVHDVSEMRQVAVMSDAIVRGWAG